MEKLLPFAIMILFLSAYDLGQQFGPKLTPSLTSTPPLTPILKLPVLQTTAVPGLSV